MKLYDLIKTYRDKTEVVMTDVLPKVKAKAKSLKASQRKGIKSNRVEYKIRVADDTSKILFKSKSEAWRGGGYGDTPPRI